MKILNFFTMDIHSVARKENLVKNVFLYPNFITYWKLVWCGQPMPLGQPQTTKAGGTRTTTGKNFTHFSLLIANKIQKTSLSEFNLES